MKEAEKEKQKELKKRTNIAITDSEKKLITDKAKKDGRSFSNYLIQLGLNA